MEKVKYYGSCNWKNAFYAKGIKDYHIQKYIMTYQENNQYLFGINPFYVCVSMLSILLFGPFLTFIMISAIGFFKSYTRISIGALLSAITYYMFGYAGLVMFKIACLYTIFNIYYMTFINNKIGNNFSYVNSTCINTRGSNITDKYENFRNYTIDTVYRMKNYISTHNYKINKIIDTIVTIYPVFLDKGNLFYLEVNNNIHAVHRVLYESHYDIYMYISDYIYDLYMMVKFIAVLFNTSTKSTGSFANFAQPTPDETKKIINQFSNTLSTMMASLSSVEYDSSYSFKTMNNDMFMKLLKI